jgi:hypothetical protein
MSWKPHRRRERWNRAKRWSIATGLSTSKARKADLDQIAKSVLGVGLEEIKTALP